MRRTFSPYGNIGYDLSPLFTIQQWADARRQSNSTSWNTIRGGNERWLARLAATLKEQIHYGSEAIAIENGEETATVTVLRNGRRSIAEADRVIVRCRSPCCARSRSPRSCHHRKERSSRNCRAPRSRTSSSNARGEFGDGGWARPLRPQLHRPRSDRNDPRRTFNQPGPRAVVDLYMVGPQSETMDELDEAERLPHALVELERVFPGISDVAEGAVYHSWNQDPFSRGDSVLCSSVSSTNSGLTSPPRRAGSTSPATRPRSSPAGRTGRSPQGTGLRLRSRITRLLPYPARLRHPLRRRLRSRVDPGSECERVAGRSTSSAPSSIPGDRWSGPFRAAPLAVADLRRAVIRRRRTHRVPPERCVGRRPAALRAEPAPRTRSPREDMPHRRHRGVAWPGDYWAVATPPAPCHRCRRAPARAASPLAYAIARLGKRFLVNDATADVRVDGVLRGVQTERNRETLRDTQTTLLCPMGRQQHPFARVVVPAAIPLRSEDDGVRYGVQTERNSPELRHTEATDQRRTGPAGPGSLRLGAGRSQVQILSPRLGESAAEQRFCSFRQSRSAGHGVQYGVQFLPTPLVRV